MIHLRQILLLLLLLGSMTVSSEAFARDSAIDTADPTRVYNGIGISAGLMTYTNDESREELRGVISWALTNDDMLQIESGYGRHVSDTSSDETGLVRTRIYYRQRLPFDDSLTKGFRGMAFQLGVHLSGALKGTDGQTIISSGAIPAIRFSESFDFYPMVDVVNCFDKNFEHYNGFGFDVAPRLSYSPNYLWPGAVLQLELSYTQFLIGQLALDNSRNLKITGGGTLFKTLHWSLSVLRHEGRDLLTWGGENSAELKHDLSASFQLLAVF